MKSQPDEIKLRHFHRIALEKVEHVVHEQVDVHGLEHLVVVVSVDVDGRLLAVDKIVIHADDMRPEPERS